MFKYNEERMSVILQGSLFEVEPKFCQIEYLRQFEHAQFNLFHAFFLTANFNQLGQEEMEKFQNTFAKRFVKSAYSVLQLYVV